MDFPFSGFLPASFGQNGPWWFAFSQVPNLPELLIHGKEKEYISWFFRDWLIIRLQSQIAI